MPEQPPLTRLLADWHGGNGVAFEQLSSLVYDELKTIARRMMASERDGHTLQPTALVNEAFVGLMNADANINDRRHFFALAAGVMRRLLVDHARSKQSAKRGGDYVPVTLITAFFEEDTSDVLELDDALTKLAVEDERLANAVELIYFGGLTYEEAAKELGMSRTTLVGELRFAKAWLQKAMA